MGGGLECNNVGKFSHAAGKKQSNFSQPFFFAKKIKLIPDIFVISFENRKIFPDTGGKRSIFYNEHRGRKKKSNFKK